MEVLLERNVGASNATVALEEAAARPGPKRDEKFEEDAKRAVFLKLIVRITGRTDDKCQISFK